MSGVSKVLTGNVFLESLLVRPDLS